MMVIGGGVLEKKGIEQDHNVLWLCDLYLVVGGSWSQNFEILFICRVFVQMAELSHVLGCDPED